MTLTAVLVQVYWPMRSAAEDVCNPKPMHSRQVCTSDLVLVGSGSTDSVLRRVFLLIEGTPTAFALAWLPPPSWRMPTAAVQSRALICMLRRCRRPCSQKRRVAWSAGPKARCTMCSGGRRCQRQLWPHSCGRLN